MNTTNKILVVIAVGLLLFIGYLNFMPTEAKMGINQNSQNLEPETAVPESHSHDETTRTDVDHASQEVASIDEAETTVTETTIQPEEITTTNTLPDSQYLSSYTISDNGFDTETVVTVSGDTRSITTNALPNHETGAFPTQGNPNTISAQSNSYQFPLNPTYTGIAAETRSPGVGINGILFEPGTAERVTCESGEEYRIVGLQDTVNLGMDLNNAHVQPTGLYHYHGSPAGLIEFASSGGDLAHVGFAADGHLMYYSQSDTDPSSYRLKTPPRTGTDCVMSGPGDSTTTVAGTMPDGTYESDWEYNPAFGSLDECNGIEIDGQYVYMVTDSYPFIGRCLMGEFVEEARGGGGPSGTSAPTEQGVPPGGPGGRPTSR